MDKKFLEYSKPELVIYRLNVEDIMLASDDELEQEDNLLLPVNGK